MLKILIVVAFILCDFVAFSQFGPQQIISTESHLPVRVVCGDINGDGSLDVAIASRSISTPYNVAWLSNTDGQGNFGSINLIGTMNETYRVNLADLDNDGDLDVMAANPFLDLVVWYRNLDGLGSFSPGITISNLADGANDVIGVDIDSDGDIDVVSASDFSGLAWYENLDGQGDFSPPKIINNIISNSRSVMATDMDGDGDMDILGNASNPIQIFWMENVDGQGIFGTMHIIHEMGAYANIVFASDIDGDNDMDVFSASPYINEVAWYQNIDGLGNFGTKNIISNTLSNTFAVYVEDLDNDGDKDVLSTRVDALSGEVVWFENLDGLGSFSTKNNLTNEVDFPRDVYVADIDNDGDMDVLSVSQNDDKIAWYENLTIMAVAENNLKHITLYPNPATDFLFVEAQQEVITKIVIYDLMGKEVLNFKNNREGLNIEMLQAGIYILKVYGEEGIYSDKFVKK